MANKKKKIHTPQNVVATQKRKYKAPIGTYIFLFFVATYLVIKVTSIYDLEQSMADQIDTITAYFKDPFVISISMAFGVNLKLTMCVLFVAYSLLFCYIVYDVTKIRDFMPGQEMGVGEWGDIEKINQKFMDYERERANRIYSEHLRISMDGYNTRINNNVIYWGGSGVGKTKLGLTPNLYQANVNDRYPGSFVITDPKGELLRENGMLLKERGYILRVLNLVPGMMEESDCINTFEYIWVESDVDKLCTNIFANTNSQAKGSQIDPFWDNAAMMFLKSLILLVRMEYMRYGWECSMNTVISLLNKAEVLEEGEESALDTIFRRLVIDTAGEENGGKHHPAYMSYHKVMVGAADTIRSIIITLNTRLNIFQNKDIQRIMAKNEIDLSGIGSGIVDGKKNQRTAFFIVIPDSDTTYNAVAGMAYTMLFQELYYQADHIYEGVLPVPVTCWFDEFANIALPDGFPRLLSTMRSRDISSVIILQNQAQLESLYKDEHKSIVGNCDVSVYLGGNEQSTFKYISENLGKKTIHKRSSGYTRGSNSSSSSNEDVLGRELMLPEEVRELDNEYCVVFVRGQKPVLDHKYRTFEDATYKHTKTLGNYIHSQQRNIAQTPYINIGGVTDQTYLVDFEQTVNSKNPFLSELASIVIENDQEEEAAKEIDISDMTILELLSRPDFHLSADCMEEVQQGIRDNLTEDEIKSYILFEDAEKMRSMRLLIETLKIIPQGNSN